MNPLRILAAVGLSLGLASCGGGGSTGPTAGTLKVTLTTPNSDDGAILFAIGGGPIDSVHFGTYVGYTRKVNADSVVVVVAGNIAAGQLVTFDVPDVGQAVHYQAGWKQAAARVSANYAERAPGGYALNVSH